MKKLFSAILSTALVFSTVAGAAASDISLTAKSCIVKSDDDTDNVFVSENFSSYTPDDNLIVTDEQGNVSFTTTDNFSVLKTKSMDYTADSFIGFVSDPTDSNNGNVLKLQADNESFFPVVRYDKGINTPHNKSKKLSVKASLFIDKDTAKGLFVSEDYNDSAHTPKWSRLDAETIGFMSVWASPWNDGKRQYAIGTLAFDNTKVSKTDGSYTFDGKTIPAYINAPRIDKYNGDYTSTNNTSYHLVDVSLPVGEWFDVEFVYDLPNATANTSENGSVPMTVYIAGKQVYSDNVIIPKETENNNFYNVYRGVAFSPNAYINADSKGEVKPIMYVDNIESKYFSEKLVDEDFSNGYTLNTNFNTKENSSGSSNFTIRKSYDNAGGAQTYTTNNSISVVDEAQKTNKILKLTSSTDSIFPVVSYVPSKDTEHQKNKQLVVKADLFFDKSTVEGYKLNPDPDESPYRLYDKSNMGFVSVFGEYSDWSNRSKAITTIAFDTSKSSTWNDYSYIPAYINAPNTKGNDQKGYNDATNTGEHLKDVTLPTDKWFEVKFVYDLPGATDNTSANGTVPFTVYIDGEEAYSGDAILPEKSKFATSYQGIAFSPNAYMADDNNGSVSPTMYVDNIAAYYTVAEEYLKFSISNTSSDDKTFALIAAFYNADGSLDNVVIKDEYKVGATTTVTDTFKLNDVELSDDVSTVKLFAWDNFTDMQPLAPLSELTVN